MMEESKILGVSVDQKTQNVVTNIAVIVVLVIFINEVLKAVFDIDLFAMVRGLFGKTETKDEE